MYPFADTIKTYLIFSIMLKLLIFFNISLNKFKISNYTTLSICNYLFAKLMIFYLLSSEIISDLLAIIIISS